MPLEQRSVSTTSLPRLSCPRPPTTLTKPWNILSCAHALGPVCPHLHAAMSAYHDQIRVAPVTFLHHWTDGILLLLGGRITEWIQIISSAMEIDDRPRSGAAKRPSERPPDPPGPAVFRFHGVPSVKVLGRRAQNTLCFFFESQDVENLRNRCSGPHRATFGAKALVCRKRPISFCLAGGETTTLATQWSIVLSTIAGLPCLRCFSLWTRSQS